MKQEPLSDKRHLRYEAEGSHLLNTDVDPPSTKHADLDLNSQNCQKRALQLLQVARKIFAKQKLELAPCDLPQRTHEPASNISGEEEVYSPP